MLQQEANHLQIVGRALTPSEQNRVRLLLQTVDNLEAILNPPDEGEPTEISGY